MLERDGKSQGKDGPKQVCSSWFARHSWLATSGANVYRPGVFLRLSMPSMPFALLFCVFGSFSYFLLSLNPRPFILFFSISMCPGRHTQLADNCRCPLLFCFVFTFLGMPLFFSIMYRCCIHFYGEYVVRFSSGWYSRDRELDFDINQSKHVLK